MYEKHLNKVVGNAIVTYPESHDDLEALSPSLFIIGRRLTDISDPDQRDINSCRL